MLSLGCSALTIEILEFDLFVIAAEQHEVLDFLRQGREWRFDVEFRMPRQGLDQLKIVGIAPIPAAHGAAGKR